MSAASESAASPSPCACTNISLMQLFHELKQKFPGVPDHVVSNTIELYCHDKHACETHLHSEAKASLTHAYHASSSAAARQLNELKVDAPLRCRNQPIVKQQVPYAKALTSIVSLEPQNAILSSIIDTHETEEKHKNNTDANQNIVEAVNIEATQAFGVLSLSSPTTVINLDNCVAKSDSPNHIELVHDGLKDENCNNNNNKPNENIEPENINYRILKSNKIKCNLHERLERGKDKKPSSKKEIPPQSSESQEKPKRPCTLDFVKPNTDIAFKQNLQEPEPNQCRSISPAPSTQKPDTQPKDVPDTTYWQDRGYPLNLSVNVNCHMDLGRAYPDPWLESFDSPRAITSLNLTVCTPTSNMASPIRERRDDDSGFEGHFTVTVSPSTIRPPPRRRAPPPPTISTNPLEPQRTVRQEQPSNDPTHPVIDRSLIERQKARLGQLVDALEQERERLKQLTRETAILAALPNATSLSRLREEVQMLRENCGDLLKRNEINVPESGSFYRNIYTGQRVSRAAPPPPSPAPPHTAPSPAPAPPAAYWECHMCTFRNHPLLDKCEECDMPRILVVRAADGITVRLMPGRRKIVHSWVL